jgi:hypothetical protein
MSPRFLGWSAAILAALIALALVVGELIDAGLRGGRAASAHPAAAPLPNGAPRADPELDDRCAVARIPAHIGLRKYSAIRAAPDLKPNHTL